MNEPATKEDLEAAKAVLIERLGKIDRALDGLRKQNSAEHGSLFIKQTHLTNLMHWIKDAWSKFSILPPPPVIKPPHAIPPKDDTQ